MDVFWATEFSYDVPTGNGQFCVPIISILVVSLSYLNDVVIYSSDGVSHLPKVQTVVDSLRRSEFKANPKKFTLGQEEASYLGYTNGRGLIKAQVDKVEVIQNWP